VYEKKGLEEDFDKSDSYDDRSFKLQLSFQVAPLFVLFHNSHVKDAHFWSMDA